MESVTTRKRLSEVPFQFLTYNNTISFPIQSRLEIIEVKMHTLDTRACAISKPLSPNERNQERVAGVRELEKTRLQCKVNKSMHIISIPRISANAQHKTSHYHNWRESPKSPPMHHYVYSTTFTTIKSSSPLFQPHEPPHPFKFLRTGGYTKQTECPSCTQNQLPF